MAAATDAEGSKVRRYVWSWLGAKTGVPVGAKDLSPVRPAGAPAFEPLEPRLLLNADLLGLQPPLTCGVSSPEQAVYVDLDRQDGSVQTDPSPVLTIEVVPRDEANPSASTRVSSANAAAQVAGGIVAESSSLDSSGIAEDDAAGPVVAGWQDIALGSDASSVGIRGPPAGTEGQQAVELFSVSPALFVENQGQWSDSSVRYVHDGNGVDVAIIDAGVLFRATDADAQMFQFSAVFVGANLVQPVGLEQSGSVFNYCVGDQANWRQNVPSYAIVAYEGLYEGIDLRVQGLRSHVKYEFHVAPGADYSRIAVRYEGIEGLSPDEDGSLVVDLGGEWGVIQDDAPYIYQEIDGQRLEVGGRFVVLDNHTYSFELTGTVDPEHELVIDPDLAWSTYLGGSSNDYGRGVAVDASGGVYVTGYSESSGWTSGGFDTTLDGTLDAFVAKLSSSGEHLWSTYLGGSSNDSAQGIGVDASGSVYVAGYTRSSGWTSAGFDTTLDGTLDAFVAKLSASGEHLWSTYLGGSSVDYGLGIAVDASGGVYVTGRTESSGWTSGGFDTTYNGTVDAFVAKVSAGGAHLWSSYLGGSDSDQGYGIAVDASGSVYVTGNTNSSGWTSAGFDTTFNGGSYDAFVAKLSASGEHLWSTYLGGTDFDQGLGIAVDASGSVYVAGGTRSSGWTSGGFDTTYNGGSYDAFVAKLSASGEHLWSTYLGGGSDDGGFGDRIAVDSSGSVYVTGDTNSSGWTSGGFDTTLDGLSDAFVAKLSASGEHLWSTYLGGSASDQGYGIAVDASGSVYVAGYTTSSGWTSGGFDTTLDGPVDAFVAKLTDMTPPSPNPSTWATEPYATGPTSIRMVATTATDVSGVEYYFQETSGNPGATDSGWQDSNTYEDTGLSGSTTYTYQVKARDKSAAYNETSYSAPGSATTEADTTPPSPNPSTWVTGPYATGSTSIRMVATVATDVSGVEYYFHETSGNPGGTNSGWQDSSTYEDTGLSAGTTYSYAVKTRDKSSNHNETDYSDSASATTASPVYRFWKASDNTHFFTIKESEKQKLIDNYSHIYTYEGPAYYAFTAGQQPAGTLPVYRFWKPSDNTHFFTMKESEKQKLIDNYSHMFTFEGPAYYAYGIAQHPLGTLPLYRFWKPSDNTHFFTIRESEKDKLIALFSHIVTFEGIAWYAYAV